MSLFSWFSGPSSNTKQAGGRRPPDGDRSGLTQDERTRPVAGARPKPSAPPATKIVEGGKEQKSRRHAKREQLYAAIRATMTRAGVLSASYKFKVLSLDPRGDQFMIMMDLAQEFGGQTDRLAEIEVMIAQSAKASCNIRVSAVYWRMNELVSTGRPRPSIPGAQFPGAPAAVHPETPAAATVVTPVPATARFEPIHDDEVAAFKQALAAAAASGGAAAAAKGVTTRTGPHSYTLLTGFEDTEMPDVPTSAPALSPTQYGDLM